MRIYHLQSVAFSVHELRISESCGGVVGFVLTLFRDGYVTELVADYLKPVMILAH